MREGNIEAVSRSAQYIANFEPITLMSALAAVTARIGLTCTASTSFNEPYHVARKFASLDHIGSGRAGWNLVTSGMLNEARNFNLDVHYGHAERYRRANEFAEVVTALWDSVGRQTPSLTTRIRASSPARKVASPQSQG